MTKMLRIATLALALGALAVPVLAADKEKESATPAAATPATDPVVARVNGEEIRRSVVARELQAMGPRAQQLPMALVYQQLLQKVISTKLVSSQGYAQKLEGDTEVKERLKDVEAQLVADAYIRKTVQPKITDAKLKVRYDELVAKFKPEDEVRARHILLPTAAEATAILKQLKSGGDFAKLATEKSKDTGSAKQGGDLGFFARGAMVKPFADAAFGLKIGATTEKPVKTDFGYHVIKLEERRKSSPPPMDEVKDELTNQVGQELVGELLKDLETKAKIERFNPDGTTVKEKEKEKTEDKPAKK